MRPSQKNKVKDIVLYFQVHQPLRLQKINFLDIANSPSYFDDALNERIVRRVADECYLPANTILLELLQKHPNLKITFSLSGIVIEQLVQYAPAALESFRKLAQTGAVDFLGETYYHSLSSLVNGEEFEIQVLQHAELIYEVFGVRPSVFRNTELIYHNDVGYRVAMMGFHGIFIEGHESILGSKTPHTLYSHPTQEQFRILARNYRLSDDIAFRFREGGAPLTVQRYMSWLKGIPADEKLICLAMDFETFGEHHKAESGIFDFLREFLTSVAEGQQYRMLLPLEAIRMHEPAEPLSVDHFISWADLERDLSAWLGNDMQKDAFNSIMKLESEVKNLGDKELLAHWRTLQTSDHFYYMSLKTDADGSVHAYFSPFESSYEAFISYMNVVTHLSVRINEEKLKPQSVEHDLSSLESERQNIRTSTPVWAMSLTAGLPGAAHETKD